ncbi:MAG: hypothetical protein F4Y69_09940 [Chloroflexi bacterium]|nr:hypothetical protein [Chloroflexota bacterium]MYF22796.1 hypothetical protein [Chloroflexota bacterium]
MKARFALTLVLPFAGGVLLMAGLGGATGIFDRGPSDLDVHEADARGYEQAIAEAEIGMPQQIAEQRQRGYNRGRESAEWIFLDRMPNPDSWFAGVQSGRTRLIELAEEAYQQGLQDGEREGRNEALGARRLNSGDEPPEILSQR